MNDQRKIWTAGRMLWTVVLLTEIIFLLQVLFSEQRWESALVMVAVNVFLLPVVAILFAVLAFFQKRRVRRENKNHT